MARRLKLGELLVRAGAITPDKLETALREQSKWGLPLGMTLIELKFIDEETLVRTLARQLKVPLAWLRGKRIKPGVIDLIPSDLARKHRYLPLTVREEPGGRVLFLGMQDPGDVESLDNVRFRIGWNVRPILVAPSELEEALERYYPSGDSDSPDHMLDLDPPASDKAREKSESAEDSGASEEKEDRAEPEAVDASELVDDEDAAEDSEKPEESDAWAAAENWDSGDSWDAAASSGAAEAAEAEEAEMADEDSSEGWDMSEEWEVTAEPEFLLLEEVVQDPTFVPSASLQSIAAPGEAVSPAASEKLTDLVVTLVEEGVIERETLIDRLNGESADSTS